MAITHEMYQTLYGRKLGRERKRQSDMLELATWDGDIATQTAYIYDYYHDLRSGEKFRLENLHPQDDGYKTPLEIKFIRHSSQSYSKDPDTFWIQLKPGQECPLDYYDAELGKKYGANFPVGLYIDIMGEDGTYNRWLVVNTANRWQNQFPTWEILKCDYILQWVRKGNRYECPAVLRSQLSYNSGLWTDYKTTGVEDTQKVAVPLNEVTELIDYDQRFIIDTNLYNPESEPRAWKVSKTKRISPNGICTVTFAQDKFNQHVDYIERDSDGIVIGKWASYYELSITPKEQEVEDDLIISTSAKITMSGIPNQIKVGGSKTFTVKFYEDEQEVAFQPGEWSFFIDGETASSDILSASYPSESKCKVKFCGGDDYIGKILSVGYRSGDVSVAADVQIMAF